MFKMAPEDLDVQGFFTKKEWSGMTEEIRHAVKCMYVLYKQGKNEKPEFLTRYEKFRSDLESKRKMQDKTPAFRLEQQKSRMRNKLNNKKVVADGVAVEQCLKGFSRLEIDESTRKKKIMDEVVRALENEIDTGPDSEPVYIKKRRLRRLKRVNYMEVEVQEDDTYSWCDECDACFRTFCPLHGPLLVIPDNKTGETELGCPPHIELRPSGIPGAGRGAWAAEPLPSGLRFGPYRGQLSSKPNPNSYYVWQIRRPNGGRQYIDGEKITNANWLRYVNCSRNPREQNLHAYQYKGQIYYRTVKNIDANTELLVWYGSEFGKQLGIDPKTYHTPLRTQRTPLQGGSCSVQRDEAVGAPTSRMGPNHSQPSTSSCKGQSTSLPLLRKKLLCDRCEYSTNNKENLKQHNHSHTGEKPFSCDVCTYTCNLVGNLKRHKLTHTGEKPFSCDVCVYTCSQAVSLKKHKLTHTGEKPFSCDVCVYTCSQAVSLKKHKLTHTGEKPFSCDVCVYTCSQASNLKSHKLTHTGEKPFSCDVCTYTCNHAISLKSHKLTHSGEKPFSCDVCTYSCAHAFNLKSHKLTHTGEKPFSCDVCVYTCSQAVSLKRHKLTHTGEKPFSCDVCVYTCSQASNLKSHKLTHTVEKPFSCDVCTYTCNHAVSLKRHKLTHTGEKPFSCDVCVYTCSQASNLKSHKLTHTGEKPFSCDVCTYTCNHAVSLKRHKLTHTGEKPFSCAVCGKSFTGSQILKCHKCIHNM